jgi:hypothetical protein
MIELIESLCVESSGGRLTFRAASQMGSLYLLEGHLVDAHFKSLTGIEALSVVLGFETGEYRFVSGLRSEHPSLEGSVQDLFRSARVSQRQVAPAPSAPPMPTPVANPASSGTVNLAPTHLTAARNPTMPEHNYLPTSFFEEVRSLLNELRISQPGVILARAMVGLGDDLSNIPKARVLDFVRNVENEINPRQAQTFRQSMSLSIEALQSSPMKQTQPQAQPQVQPQAQPQVQPNNTTTGSSETRAASAPTSGLRTVAATLQGRIPGSILSSTFINEVRQTLEQLRVFNADNAIDRAAENLGFYPAEIPGTHTKKFLTAVIAEITGEQGYQFQQLLEATTRELDAQGKASKAPAAERSNPLGVFANPLAARAAKASSKPEDPALEFLRNLQKNLGTMVTPNVMNALIQAAATDLGIQNSTIAPGSAQKFVQAISQRLDGESAQKFQRMMALSVGVYTAQR